jgi:phosphohistidine phosphatase SixA
MLQTLNPKRELNAMSALLSMITALILLIGATEVSAQSETQAWEALREGKAVLILRHALAPGTGDPAHFELGDCSTQRNLNDRGRQQASAWIPYLARQDIADARIYTSLWCRSRDTATGMNIGEVTEWPALNSFFQNRGKRSAQTIETIELVNGLEPGPPVIMVSHQVNITALSGVFPASNEGVILALPLTETPEVLARVAPN